MQPSIEQSRPLDRLTRAERARSVIAASASLVWAASGEAGVAPYYDECGLPLMLASDELCAELLESGTGRVEFDLHPGLGLVRLAGQFWAVANPESSAVLEQVRRQHADCTSCPAHQFRQVIGLQVVTAAIRLPGESDFRPIDLDEYVLADPDPIAVLGATLSVHLNTDHEPELAILASALTRIPATELIGARIGAIDINGFELSAVGMDGGHQLFVPFPQTVTNTRALPEVMHDAIATAVNDPGRSRPGH